MKTILSIFVAGLLIFAVSCSDDSNPSGGNPPVDSKLVKDLSADTTGGGSEWVYFSFADNSEIPYTDSNSTKWDIAFKTTSIICNSRVRGPGFGAIQFLTGTDFAALKEAPESGYFSEDEFSPLAINKSNTERWYNYNPDTHIISPTPGGVIVLKTADGKYVKIRIISYYQGAPEIPDQESKSRYYTFEYVYQPDGSRNF